MLALVVPQANLITAESLDHVLVSDLSIVVELVKAADIKVIAALGDSLTVSVIVYTFLFTFKDHCLLVSWQHN